MYIARAVHHPFSCLCLTLVLPVLLSVIAISSFTVEINVSLSSFEVSNTHPVAVRADSL